MPHPPIESWLLVQDGGRLALCKIYICYQVISRTDVRLMPALSADANQLVDNLAYCPSKSPRSDFIRSFPNINPQSSSYHLLRLRRANFLEMSLSVKEPMRPPMARPIADPRKRREKPALPEDVARIASQALSFSTSVALTQNCRTAVKKNGESRNARVNATRRPLKRTELLGGVLFSHDNESADRRWSAHSAVGSNPTLVALGKPDQPQGTVQTKNKTNNVQQQEIT